MKKKRLHQLIYLLVCAVSVAIVCTESVNAQKAANCRPQIVAPLANVDDCNATVNCEPSICTQDRTCRDRAIAPAKALEELAKANVVYLGETHDSLKDHKIQLQIVRELQRRNSQVAIAMEMFQKPYQAVLNQYLAGKLSEREFLEQTEYNQRWGYPWEYYAPVLRFAKEKQLPVLALNTPSEISRQVAKSGLESLTLQQKQLIPPISEIRTDNSVYRQLLAKTFQQHQHSGHGNSRGFERFFLAQVLWDETMADEIAKFLKANPKYQVVVLAGQGHIIYGYGIPSRVARRIPNRQFSQLSVLLSSPQFTAINSNQPIANYIMKCQPS